MRKQKLRKYRSKQKEKIPSQPIDTLIICLKNFYSNYRLFLKVLASVFVFCFSTYFLLKPDVQIGFDKTLNSYDPLSVLFYVDNNSNLDIQNFDHKILVNIRSPNFTMIRSSSYHNNRSDPNFQSPIPIIKSGSRSTLNKTGVSVDKSLVDFAEIIIIYNYNYLWMNIKDSIKFRVNKTSSNIYYWDEYSF